MQQLPPGFQLDGQPAQPSRAPGIIRGAPSQAERRAEEDQMFEQRRLEMEAERLRLAQQNAALDAAKTQQDLQAGQIDLQTDQDKQARLQQMQGAATADLRRVIDKIDEVALDAADNAGWLETGFTGSVASVFPGSAAFDLRKNIDTIDANNAFTRLQQMRDASPTGGALGQVTERELDLLKSTIANLDPNQSQGQFLQNLAQAKRAYIDMLERLEPGSSTEFNSRPGIRFADDGTVTLTQARGEERGEVRELPGFNSGGTPPDNGGGGLSLSQIGTGLAQGTGDIVQGIGDFVGTFTDPIAGVLAEALGYDSSQMQSLGTVAREGSGLPQSPEGAGRQAREFAASALAGGGVARGLSALASPGVTRNVLAQVGRTPIRDTAAGAGAGAGAYVGEQQGGTLGALGGLALGGVAGYGAANAVSRMASGGAPNALAQASTRQGVDLLPADAGGPVSRAVTTGTRASPISVGPVANAAERQQRQFGDAVRNAAASVGEVVDTQQAGNAVRQGAENFIKQSQQRGNRLYERAYQQARGVTAIKPLATVEAAQEALARMKENPAASASEISSLESFIANIQGGVSIQGLRDARTALSQGVYDGRLRSSSDQAMWKGILSNVADDIDRGLRAVGRDEAADTFRMADRLWSERIEVIDKTLQPILGRDGMKGGEEVLQAIESMARGQRGGNQRLSRVLGALEPEQARNVRATIVDRLGRATPGAQDAQGEAFSAATFLTNWNKMTPQGRASLFPDKGLRDSLNDLATIAEGTKRSQQMANTSNTGIAVNTANVIAGGVGVATNIPVTLLGAGSAYLTGRLMASPRFARLLARTSKMPPEAANRTFREQLAILSTREPMLSDDIGRLTQAINDNGRLAAEENQPQN